MTISRLSLLSCGALLCLTSAQAVDLCHSGRAQSPAAITQADINAPALPPLQADYRAAPLVLDNDGHTLRVRLKDAGALQLGSNRYTLTQFHFHTPGGETLDGEAFPFSAHVLHRGVGGGLLALTVPFRLGAENPLLTRLLPLVPAAHAPTVRVTGASVNAIALLGSDRRYLRYKGSLTDAPCTEGVDWLVLRQPQTLSAAQLAQWKKLFADNMRAPQPLNGRRVGASKG